MKCPLFFLNLSILLSNVVSLRLVLQPNTIVGSPTLVLWEREPTDPADLSFDLRFVQGEFTDVGLAMANVFIAAGDAFGTLSVVFPTAGKYVLKAVSGSPRNTQIGTSNAVEAIQVASSSSSPTPSPPSTSSSTTSSPTPTPPPPTSVPPQSMPTLSPSQSKATKRNVNLPAVVGGVIGALIFLALLAALLVFIKRRRAKIKKRFTFHNDMMVQRRLSRANPSLPVSTPVAVVTPLPYPFSAPPDIEAQTRARLEDVEQGLPNPVPHTPRPHVAGHIVPSPRGPRPSVKRTEQIVITSSQPSREPAPSRTRRQQEIADRITQLGDQMSELQRVRKPNATQLAVLDDMERQMVWLRDHEQSPWALGLTDVLPPGYARYMTP